MIFISSTYVVLTQFFIKRLFVKRSILLSCLLVAAFHGRTVQSETLPTVASVNLCADQLVLLLAEPEQILSLSNLSHDKAGSYFYSEARHFPVNRGNSEQILKLAPDVIIGGEFTTRYTLKLLDELGMRVETLPIPNTLEQMYENIESVALWLGRESSGKTIVAKLRERVERQQMQLATRRAELRNEASPSAAYYGPNGFTVGGGTLSGQVLELSGWQNTASSGGIEFYGTLPLESLIQLAPDALIDSPYSADTYSRGQQLLKHPALRESGLAPEVISIPSRQSTCAGPWTIDTLETLFNERDKFMSAKSLRQ